MNTAELSKEELILKSVKMVITQVAKDTATEPGLKHPLSDQTIKDLRDCLVLITEREQELAQAAGRPLDERPRFVDEPRPTDEVVVPIGSIKRPS